MTGMGAMTVVLAIPLADAALSDLRGYRIPDRDSLAAAAVFLVGGFILMDPADVIAHMGVGIALFAAGTVLFALGLWGGGDVKLLAACGLWTGLAGLPRFLLVMALAGGVLALLVLAARRLAALSPAASAPWRQRLLETTHLPYGVAIAIAGLDLAARGAVAG